MDDRYFVIAHGDDPDGIIAAGLLTGHLTGKNCKIHLVCYGERMVHLAGRWNES